MPSSDIWTRSMYESSTSRCDVFYWLRNHSKTQLIDLMVSEIFKDPGAVLMANVNIQTPMTFAVLDSQA